MKRTLLTVAMLATSFAILQADPITFVPNEPIPGNPTNPRSPITLPEFYIDGYTLTAASNTLGSTVELIDGSGSVVFSTYVYIEGDIELPATLSGTYTIRVTRGGQAFIGEITV